MFAGFRKTVIRSLPKIPLEFENENRNCETPTSLNIKFYAKISMLMRVKLISICLEVQIRMKLKWKVLVLVMALWTFFGEGGVTCKGEVRCAILEPCDSECKDYRYFCLIEHALFIKINAVRFVAVI